MSDDTRVTVAVRVRPKIESATNATQTAERYQPEAVTKVSEDTVRISETRGKDVKSASFTYDFVFDRDSTQEELYDETTQEAVDGALQGRHATIMTYGQTGSGKTYTVLGAVKANPLANDVVTADTGLFLRALRDLLGYAERCQDLHVVLGLSVVEIYLDSIRDLLAKDPTKNIKPIIDQDNVQLPDLTVSQVHTLRDAVDVYRVATSKRVARATEANDQSSRSHALFIIEVFQIPKSAKNEDGGLQSPSQSPRAADDDDQGGDDGPMLDHLIHAKEKMLANPKMREKLGGHKVPLAGWSQPAMYSKIVLTDLAGSEKLKHSNATGQGFEEMKEINKSLTALGNVVHALFSGQKHVPYRDSKLTVLLRSTFSAPNAKVVLIANVAPTQLTYDETQSTLFFANKVKAMNAKSTGGSDLKSETDYLNTLKTTEEIFADLRIVKESHYYETLISKGILPRTDAAQQFFRVSSFGKEAEKKKAKWNPKNHPKFSTAEKYLGDLEAKAQSTRNRDKEELQRTAHQQFFEKIVGEYKAKRGKQEDDNKEVDAALDESRSQLQNEEGQLKKQIAEVESSISSLEKEHITADSTKSAHQIKKEKLKKELEDVKVKLDAQIAKFMADNADVENAWKAWEKSAEAADHVWNCQHSVMKVASETEKEIKKFSQALGETHAVYSEGCDLRYQCSMIEFREELKDLLVDRAYEQYVKDFRAAQMAAIQSSSSSSPPPGMRPPPKARPKSKQAAAEHADPNEMSSSNGPSSAPPRKPGGGGGGGGAPPPRKPPSLFDMPSLLGSIIEYMEGGASLLKHGRSGKPHYRYFYVYREIPQGEDPLTNSPECRNHLCWCDEEPTKLKLLSNAVDLSSVTAVTIGKHSTVFDRSFKMRDGIQNNEYYCAFSLHYKSGDKGEVRTMDIVCEMTSELESWVIGLCYLTKVNPVFGKGLDIVSESSRAAMQNMEEIETDAEKELVSMWHIPPRQWVSIINKLGQIAERRRMKKAMITAGELCTLTQFDIFRSTAMWRLLVDQGLILKPRFMGRSYLEFDKLPEAPSASPPRPPPRVKKPVAPPQGGEGGDSSSTTAGGAQSPQPAPASSDPSVSPSAATPGPRRGESSAPPGSDNSTPTNELKSPTTPTPGKPSSATPAKSPAPKKGFPSSVRSSTSTGATPASSTPGKSLIRPPPKKVSSTMSRSTALGNKGSPRNS